MIYFLLFKEFFLIGLLAVGGGAATIPFLFDLSRKYKWFSVDELTDIIAVSQATPGPIGVNMATFAGFQTAGVLGSVCATCGLVLPSLMIVLLFIQSVHKFSCQAALNDVLILIRPVVCALILNAFFEISAFSFQSLPDFLFFGLILILMYQHKRSAVFYIGLSGMLGFIFGL